MVDDIFVIDAVAHPYNWHDDNRLDSVSPETFQGLVDFVYFTGHAPVESQEPGYRMTREEFGTKWQAEDLAHAFFVESDVDMVVAHGVEISGFAKPGGFSYWPTCLDLARIAPDRVRLYGGIDSFDPDRERVLASMERKAAEGAIGFKFYPSNGLFDAASNQQVSMLFSDPERAYPLFEKARELGITHIGVHKAQPVGPGALDAARVEDVSTAAAAYPDLTFEVVHAGWAFAEECALQLMMHTNIYANLEGTIALVVRQPRHFAHIIGTMLKYGRTEQLLYASGCALSHPDPILRAFLDFEMPQDLRDGYGYPEITPEMKRKILGGNMAALLGIDTDAVRSRIRDDRWSALRAEGKAAPWSAYRARRTVEARA